MKNTISVFFVFCFWQPWINHFSNNKTGIYKYIDKRGYASITIELKEGGIFNYKNQIDFVTYTCTGNWQYRNDTICLNSKFGKQSIPIQVKEKTVKQQGLSFQITGIEPSRVTTDINVEYQHGFKFFHLTNNNFSDTGLERPVKFQLFAGEIPSQIYTVKNVKANTFEINIDASGASENYAFVKNEKYLFKDSGLILLGKAKSPVRDYTNGNPAAVWFKKIK